MSGLQSSMIGQIWLKRVIAEMGGKDTIVVDKEADLRISRAIDCKISIWFLRSKMFCMFSCGHSLKMCMMKC